MSSPQPTLGVACSVGTVNVKFDVYLDTSRLYNGTLTQSYRTISLQKRVSLRDPRKTVRPFHELKILL